MHSESPQKMADELYKTKGKKSIDCTSGHIIYVFLACDLRASPFRTRDHMMPQMPGCPLRCLIVQKHTSLQMAEVGST